MVRIGDSEHDLLLVFGGSPESMHKKSHELKKPKPKSPNANQAQTPKALTVQPIKKIRTCNCMLPFGEL